MARAHSYQMQFSQNKTALVNGDLGHNPASVVSPMSSASSGLVAQVDYDHNSAYATTVPCLTL